MKNKLIILGILVGLSYFASPCSAQQDSSTCPPPVGIDSGGLGPRIPNNYDMMDELSPNGRMLGYLDQQGDNGAYVLDLKTLADTLIQVHGGFAIEEDINWSGIVWCPYDSDLIALNVTSFVDSTVVHPPPLYVENAFIYRISTGESQIIMPPGDNPYASTGISAWLPGSKSGMDSLAIGFFTDPGGRFNGIYVPQTKALISEPYTTDSVTLSPNGQDTISGAFIGVNSGFANAYFLNSKQFVFPSAFDTADPNMQWAFSPDSKLFALQVQTDANLYYQVWVYNVSDPTKCIDVINFQNLYCKYSLDGIWPEFITDSTLAVSMYTDGDEFSPLWEITIDGRIIRQLTFLHAASIVEGEPTISSTPLHVFPNPATAELQILDGPSGVVHLFDIMGRERMTANDDGTGATLDVSYLEAGTYFLRLGNQSAKVEIAR